MLSGRGREDDGLASRTTWSSHEAWARRGLLSAQGRFSRTTAKLRRRSAMSKEDDFNGQTEVDISCPGYTLGLLPFLIGPICR